MTTGWWDITFTIEPNDTDLQHIAEQIKQGFTSGQIIQEDPEPIQEVDFTKARKKLGML